MVRESEKIIVGVRRLAMTSPRISIVIPVFNNSNSIEETYHQIVHFLFDVHKHTNLEVIFIEDGSSDDSWTVICGLIKRQKKFLVKGIKLSRNFGQLGALVCGYNNATGDAVVTLSADLQDPVEVIPEMVQAFLEGSEVVIAHRVGRDDGLLWKFTSKIAYSIIKMSLKDIPSGGFDFSLLSRRALNHILTYQGRHRFLQGEQLHLGFKRTFIPYQRRKSSNIKSGYSLIKRFYAFIDVILDSSYWLIRFFTLSGLICGAAAASFAIWIAIQRLILKNYVEGWAFLAFFVLVTFSILVIFLGIIAEYLWRIYDIVRRKSLYIEETVLQNSKF